MELGKRLSGDHGDTLRARLERTNRAFFSLFDIWFGYPDPPALIPQPAGTSAQALKQAGSGSPFDDSLWLGLLLAPISITGGQLTLVEAQAAGDSAFILFIGMGLGFSLSLGVFVSRELSKSVGTIFIFMAPSVVGGVILCGFILLSDNIAAVGYIGFVGAFVAGLVCGSVSSSRNYIIFMIGIGCLWAVSFGVLIVVGVVIGSVTSKLNGGIIFGGLVFIYLAGVGYTLLIIKNIHLPVRPRKAIASSLFFIALVTIIVKFSEVRTDIVGSFIADVGDDFKTLAFVAFNIFADGVSLLETRWVLQRGRDATIGRLGALLLFDLATTAGIFLFLPVVLAEFSDFAEAAIFRGDRPWLGILFWSTFGTSALFYLFVIVVIFFLVPTQGLVIWFRQIVLRVKVPGYTIYQRPYASIARASSVLVILVGVLLALKLVLT